MHVPQNLVTRARKDRERVPYLALVSTLLVIGALVGGLGGIVYLGYEEENTAQVLVSVDRVQRSDKAARGGSHVLIAVGDIADCNSRGDSATAALARDLPGTVAALGDLAYDTGSRQEFAECYDPTWGTEKPRTRPAAGNHEYETRDADGYFDYFGKAAGDRGKGYYSYDLGSWHIIVLNSNCAQIRGCDADSPQGRWLRADLAAHPTKCTLAYWHHPLFSSGREHGGDTIMRLAWQMLYDAAADVVLTAHEHNYERFAPQDPAGNVDQRRGIQAFVVGTGGASHYGFGQPLPTSEVRNADTFGVLALTLRRSSYEWEFVPVNSRLRQASESVFGDSGSRKCH